MALVGDNEAGLLVVCPENYDRSFFDGPNDRFITFSFVRPSPSDGFSAWSGKPDGNNEPVDVAEECRVYTGGFSQHALNRIFARSLLQYRPYAVIIVGHYGCTVDIPRVARMMGVPALLLLTEAAEALESLDETTQRWLESSFAACKYIVPLGPCILQSWQPLLQSSASIIELAEVINILRQIKRDASSRSCYQFTYNTYEFCQRDHPLLVKMQGVDTIHFDGCTTVLDLGCGVGIFLDCLRRQGINGVGIERNPSIAEYGRGMGLDIVTDDTLNYLGKDNGKVDGIYCSHFVEHLPFDLVQKLLGLISDNVKPNGVVVMVFPDPESIRSQLLGFWRDPEHVRFYHPELIISLAAVVGLQLEWSSYEAQPHKIIPFDENPPVIEAVETLPQLTEAKPLAPGNTWLGAIMAKLGLVSKNRFEHFEQTVIEWSQEVQGQFERQNQVSQQLQERTEVLWCINKTWAWNDNVSLKFRKIG